MSKIEICRSLLSDRRPEEAIPVLQYHLAEQPGDKEAALLLAECLFQAGLVADEERIFLHCVETDPSIQALNGLGLALAARNRPMEAEALYLACLEQDESLGIVWRNLASVHRFVQGDRLIQRMKKLVKSPRLTAPERRDILYALAKAMEDLGEWERAWDYAERGAAAHLDPFDPAIFERELAEIRSVFDVDFMAKMRDAGDPTEAPVFIVGMPRSGTTLAEAVLARHPDVAALGELQSVPNTNRLAARVVEGAEGRHGWVRRAPVEAFASLAETLLRNAHMRCGEDMPARFTDKLPGNIVHLGLISCLFPNARIVRMHRDPLDNCVSCHLRRFSGGLTFTQRPDWLAAAYRFFQDAGDHYASVIANPILDLHYEDLVADSEAETRRLLAFAGLDWDDACLSPEKGSHAVTSASSAEVRRAVSTGSIGRSRRYGDRVRPLAEALGYRLDRGEAA